MDLLVWQEFRQMAESPLPANNAISSFAVDFSLVPVSQQN
jgi:hypothetical protein